MFSEKVVAAQREKLEASFNRKLQEYSISEVDDFRARLANAYDAKNQPIRSPTREEATFIQNELLLTKIDFRYWASRYCHINVKGTQLGRLFPLLESQSFLLQRIAKIEEEIFEGRHQDGILVNVLKAARQVGISTIAEAIGAHRFSTQNNIYGLIASDTPGEAGSGYLFGMFELMLENLPPYLRPVEKAHVKNSEIEFDGGSHIWVGAGKSMKGTTGQRGQLARGKTLGFCHLSELSTWDIGDQIDSALLPTMHPQPNLFVLFESTAKGRDGRMVRNWWHKHWRVCASRKFDREFVNVFIPWYAEPSYSKIPPVDWEPAATTLAHARRCEETSPRWFGHRVTLKREQLYWYEMKRAYFEAKDDLRSFLEEYGAADDDECFQMAGRGIFSPQLVQKIVDNAKPLVAMAEVKPLREVV